MAATVEQQRARYAANPAPQRERVRQRRLDDPEGYNAAKRRSYANNRVHVLARKKRNEAKLRRDVIEGYGGVCACCGNDYLPHLTLDHIAGGGAAERRLPGGGRGIYARLRRDGYPPGYQVLCWNCNAAKHHYGACRCQEGAV